MRTMETIRTRATLSQTTPWTTPWDMQGQDAAKGTEPDRSILHEYIKKEIRNGKSVSVCTMCGKSNSQKWNIMNHVESVHFPNMFTYSCKYCGKTFNAKNSLYVHMSTSHREK
eukprot:TRINITY_DN13755_c0_g1_i1.p2 TRINITY_DN13755_c0_g1~~TRINITY_DN13755_c0_g1_i1.p2  ORF type:complete len:113 (-),score=23.96 TRINITY_DN13755_c0_g1_i1:20-358(-)